MEQRAGRPPWRRYGIAVLLVTLATVVTVVWRSWFALAPLAAYFGAVAIVAWYGGAGPALAAIVLAVVAISFSAIAPLGTLYVSPADAPLLITFILVAGLITALSASRDRAEAALRASERRFRTILETANEGVWLIDRQGRTQYANDRMAALLGANPRALAAAAVPDFVFPADAAAAQAHIGANLAGRAEVFDFRFRRPDGGEVLVLAGTSPVRDDAGKIVGALGLFTDVTARRRAESELARANERFALAADAVQSLIYEWDVATNRVERSSGLQALLGYRPDEVPDTQEWWREQIYPEDFARLQSVLMGADPATDRYANEYRVRHREGHWITVLDQGRVVRDDTGAIARVVGSTIDITLRTDAEGALRLLDAAGRELASSLDYEETLQRVAWLAVPTLADWCFVDLRGRDGAIRRVAVAYADPGQAPLAATAMRYPPSPAAVGPTMQSLTTAAPVLVERVDDTLYAAAAQTQEHRALLEAFAPISLIAVPLLAAGRVHGVMTLLTTGRSGRRFDQDDLSLAEQLARRSATAIENARLYQEAREAEARYRGLFEGTRDGILVSDAQGRFIDANPAMTELSGYVRDELLRMQVGSLRADGVAGVDPTSPEELQTAPPEARRAEWELRRKDGTTIAVETDITAIRLASGLVRVAVIRDVSERKRLEQSHLEFIATVAHDLKNPLTAVRGQTQLLRRRLNRGEVPDPARLESSLETIDSSAVQMTTLLDELADVMRLRSGEEIELRREPADLVELVRRSIETYARTTERHRIGLQTNETQLVGNWDGPRLERVLGNLLGNAIKYSPRGGDIIVSLEREASGAGAAAVLRVTDEGVGIPAADLPLVFARFRRARNVATIAGTGIGLAGAKRIVELHGGTIEVASSEGRGSTFTVRLPLACDAGPDGAV